MRHSTPRWWYQRGPRSMPVIRVALTPISWIWAWATAGRIAQTVPVDPGVPVICVGNATLGGAGKTPVVRELARLLRARGKQVHVLTRGHGGRLQGPVLVDPGEHAAADVGDEALMMALDGPVWVARNRAAGALAAAEAGAEIVLMDDGHQNPSLLKTLSMLVVDGETRDDEWPFGDGAVFPAGPMREPLGASLARADAVVVLLAADLVSADPALLALFGETSTLIAHLKPVAPPPPGPQLAFAGIGKPWKMERALKAAGCELADFAPLPDHAPITEATLRFLAQRAADLGAGLLTSEKDWARLSPDWRSRVTPWPVLVVFDDETTLQGILDSALG